MERDASFLEQMAKSMEDLETSLEDYFKKRDVENFNKTKKTMIDIQRKILGAINAI
ncbi:MAG: hypothetical protein AABY03_02560 [Nanoarchaeota archaeon]